MKAIALYGKKDARIIEKPVPQAEENQLALCPPSFTCPWCWATKMSAR